MSNQNHDKTPVPESSQQSQRGPKGGSERLETPNPATEAIDKVVTPTSIKQKEKEVDEIRAKTGEGKL